MNMFFMYNERILLHSLLMIQRISHVQIRETLGQYPIIALTGPRQSGKTTLLKLMFNDFRYVNLETPDTRDFALKDPRGFLAEYNSKVIFDEVQRVPELFSYLQSLVDESRLMGQFVLSGSQNFHLMERITQSLAGRVVMFKLFPFEFHEMKSAGWLSDDIPEVFTKGFYPALFERKSDQDRYYANYIDTYVKRDVSQLINIQDNRTFNNFIKMCATRAGQLLNFNDLARDVGVSHSTIRNWLSILETSYIAFTLPPYYANFGKRIIKSSKLYFYDVGLLCHLLNIRKGDISPLNAMWGNIFENMVVSELVKQNYHSNLLRDYYFWRDSNGNEIDLLYMKGESLIIYEIKASKTIKEDMFKGLRYFNKITNSDVVEQYLIYGGDVPQKRTDLEVLPWSSVH